MDVGVRGHTKNTIPVSHLGLEPRGVTIAYEYVFSQSASSCSSGDYVKFAQSLVTKSFFRVAAAVQL